MALRLASPLTRRAVLFGFLGIAAAIQGQPQFGSTPWQDPSPHRVLRIEVTPGVELEVLDWGGTGEPLVFLTGFGNSAHVFDGFAPAFVPHFRVLGITRRGFGSSSKPAAGYDTTTLVRDILAVLDSLKIDRAYFAAHSFGGSELNYLGAHFPGRVKRLVYLDAAVDHRQLYDSPTWMNAFPAPEPPNPAYGEYGSNSIRAWVLWAERLSGPGYPEAEIRSMFRLAADTVIERVVADGIDKVLQRGTLPAELSRIRVPVLAIYAVAGSAAVMYPFWNALDPTTRARGQKSFEAISGHFARQEERFRDEVSDIRIREIPGARHYVFLTHPGEVRHEMLDFLLRRD
jgi:pimeloyl-ACP methyl ester carboxylesterase